MNGSAMEVALRVVDSSAEVVAHVFVSCFLSGYHRKSRRNSPSILSK